MHKQGLVSTAGQFRGTGGVSLLLYYVKKARTYPKVFNPGWQAALDSWYWWRGVNKYWYSTGIGRVCFLLPWWGSSDHLISVILGKIPWIFEVSQEELIDNICCVLGFATATRELRLIAWVHIQLNNNNKKKKKNSLSFSLLCVLMFFSEQWQSPLVLILTTPEMWHWHWQTFLSLSLSGSTVDRVRSLEHQLKMLMPMYVQLVTIAHSRRQSHRSAQWVLTPTWPSWLTSHSASTAPQVHAHTVNLLTHCCRGRTVAVQVNHYSQSWKKEEVVKSPGGCWLWSELTSGGGCLFEVTCRVVTLFHSYLKGGHFISKFWRLIILL